MLGREFVIRAGTIYILSKMCNFLTKLLRYIKKQQYVAPIHEGKDSVKCGFEEVHLKISRHTTQSSH
jgi:hypothetical protein